MRKNPLKCLSIALAVAISSVAWIGSAEARLVAKDPLAQRKIASKNATKSSGSGAKYARFHSNASTNKSKSKKK